MRDGGVPGAFVFNLLLSLGSWLSGSLPPWGEMASWGSEDHWSLWLREGGSEVGITPMPCLGWQRPAAAPCRVCPFLNLSWGCSLATSCHTHVNSAVRHLLVSSGLKGPCWDLGLVTGANTAPGIGCRPWVSGVLGCSCRGVSLLLKRLRSRCWSSGLRLMAVITFGAPKRPVSTGSRWHLAAGRLAPDINPRGAGPPTGTALLFQISGRGRILGPRGLPGLGDGSGGGIFLL